MKQTLQNSVVIPIELQAIEEIIKIIGGIIHHKHGYCHDEIENFKQFLIKKTQNFMQGQENKEYE
jgi:hypothetical protein